MTTTGEANTTSIIILGEEGQSTPLVTTSENQKSASLKIDLPAENTNERNQQEKDVAVVAGATILFTSIVLCLFVLISIIPTLQLIVGRHYADSCPANWHIPHYMVVAGTLGLVLIFLNIVQGVIQLISRLLKRRSNDNEPSANILPWIIKILGFVIIALGVLLLIWFFLGCYWVFLSWSSISYNNPESSNYCHPTLYRFAFWLLFVTFLFKLCTCCSAVNSIRSAFSSNKK